MKIIIIFYECTVLQTIEAKNEVNSLNTKQIFNIDLHILAKIVKKNVIIKSDDFTFNSIRE